MISKKHLVLALLGVFVGLLILQFYRDSADWVAHSMVTKDVEILNSSIVGYENGVRSYEVHLITVGRGVISIFFESRRSPLGGCMTGMANLFWTT